MATSEEDVLVRLALIGGLKYITEMNAAAASTAGVGTAAAATGRSMEHSARRSFLMQQALFTVRRVAYGATLALGAAATGAVAWGLKFNSTMEQNRVAFTYFLGSVGAANKELNVLYDLAAKTPFEFPQLTDAARKFLGFGFSVSEVNTLTKTLGDTVAGLGVGSEGIDRAVLALGQMRAAGRVLGGELRQLTEIGIPVLPILQKELGLTADQMAHIGELRIPAEVAIQALVRGLDREFGGMAAKQAKTFQGQLSTLRDYTAQALGTLTTPLFDRMRLHLLPVAVRVMQALSRGFEAGGWDEAIRRVDAAVGAHGRLITVMTRLTNAATDFWTIMRGGVLPVLWDAFRVTAVVLVPALILAGIALGILADHTWLVRAALEAYVFWLLITKGATVALVLWNTRLGLTFVAMLIMRAVTFAMEAWTVAVAIATGVTQGLAEAMVFLNLMLYANPIGLIVLAVILLIAGFALLYWKVEAFRNAVNATVSWIVDHWPILLAALTGPIGLAAFVIIHYFGRIRRIAGAVFDWIGHKADWLKNKIGSIFGRAGGFDITPGFDIPGVPFAQHGTSLVDRWTVVGERSPELFRYRHGRGEVIPLQQTNTLRMAVSGGGGGGGGTAQVTIPLYLDGRKIAETVAEIQLDKVARS